MPPKTFLFGITVIAVIIIIAGVSWTFFNNPPALSPTPSATPQITPLPALTPAPSGTPEVLYTPSPSPSAVPSPQEQVRDSTMIYIKATHPETAPIMTSLSWSSGRLDTGLVGAETIIFYSGGWTVTLQYPVNADPAYTITANYTGGDVFVIWQGTYQSGMFADENYASVNLATPGPSPSPSPSPLSTQERARDAVMAFISISHNETTQYMYTLDWTGGRVITGLIGAEKYQYLSNGWNVTMQYPVVPNPLYTMSVTYISLVSQIFPEKPIVEWQGTWQNGTVTEKAGTYKFTP
jgi:hypothetical protein